MSTLTTEYNTQFLAGGGEMGALIRSKDWTKTAIGPMEEWPQSLRTSLNIVLNSKFPMFLWWGHELTCFYNDAYRPSLGKNGKHPGILGKSAAEAWPEIWNIIKPMIDQVLSGGESIWSEDQLIPIFRNGKIEDVYWTYSHSPINDESGKVAGVLVICNETTNRVNSFKKLEESEERFQAAVSAVQGILWTNNAKGEMEGEQLGWESLTGQSYEEYQGYGWSKAIHPQDAQPTIDAWNKAVVERTTYNFEHRLKLKNGKWGIFSIRSIPIINADGSIREWVGVHTDITAQRLSEAVVKESEKRFRTMAESTSILIALIDEKGNAYYFNNACIELTGSLMEELLNFRWTTLLHLDDSPVFLEIYQHAFRHKISFTAEIRILNKEGKYKWIFVTGSARFLSNGSFAGYIISGIDITERKQLEEDFKQFKFMADNANDPFILMREDGKFEYLNKLALEKWGYTAEEAKHIRVPDVDPIFDDEKFKSIFAKAQIEIIPSFESIHKRKNGTVYPVEINMGGLIIAGRPHLFAIARDITERKKAEETLMESEERFRKVADSAPVLVWMSGTDKLCNFFNKEWLKFTGRTIDQERGNGWVEGVHEDDFEECINTYVNAFNRREKFYMEYRLKRYDGEYRWISDKGIPRFTQEGIFEGYIGACMDIQERMIYQQKLKEDEERLNIIIAASELGTWEFNLLTDEMNYSEKYLEIMGYEARSNIPHSLMLKQVHSDDLGIREQAFKKAFEDGYLHYELRIIWKESAIHWIEANGKVFYNVDKIPVKILGTLRDITEEKNYRQQLLEREQKFRLLADSMPQHIWTADPEGNLNYYNQSVFNYSGLSNDQINKDGWIQIVHPEDREENIRVWMNSIKTGGDFLFEHRFRRYDGEYRWQLSRAIPQKDSSGNIQMWVGTSTDIEEQKNFARELEIKVEERTWQLEQKNKELELMNVELQSFAYVSSHDLQEPLRKIQTFASRIIEKEQHSLSEIGKDYFRRIQAAAKRMQTLIEDLLAYSRTTTADRNFQNTDLNIIVEQVKSELNEDIEQKHAIIEVASLYEAKIIPFQFRQLVNNLIGNSIKFSKPGYPPHIIITSKIVRGAILNVSSLSPDKMYYHLSFSDNGIGFDPQYKDRIFEVFQRLHGKDEFKGTGIGLAIVKKIVENHNGIIIANGVLDKGATFDIYFPESPGV